MDMTTLQGGVFLIKFPCDEIAPRTMKVVVAWGFMCISVSAHKWRGTGTLIISYCERRAFAIKLLVWKQYWIRKLDLRMHDKIAWLIKHVSLIQWLYRKVMSLCFRIMGLFIHVDDHLVLLSSYGGDQFSDSPKVLFEAMRADPRFAEYRYVWAFADPSKFDIKGASLVKIDTLSYFRTALRAKIWITNVNIERGLHFKKKSQIYLNTWHGTGPKKGGNAVAGRKDYDFSYVDIMCCDGAYTKTMLEKYWNAKESSMLMCGRPREDELFELTEADRKHIRQELKIPDDKKVILYMPTWREYGNKELTWSLWEEKLKDEYVMLIRAHHFSKSEVFSGANSAFWIDASEYPDVNKLYWIADILISDYSSAFFDYGLLGKPMICYAYDYDQFEKSTGLLMDMKHEFPNGIMETEEDAIRAICCMNYEQVAQKCREYCASYVTHPVNATQCCIERLYTLICKVVSTEE